MKDFLILKFFDLFSILFNKLGVDYLQLRLLLRLKFNLDRRRTPSVMRNMKLNLKKDRNLFAQSFIFYIIIGFMLGVMALVPTLENVFLGETVFFTMLLMMLTNLFILEFSIDIFDVSDRDILYPLPINQRTVNLAKNIHIMLYMLAITVAFTLPYTIALGFLKSIPIAFATLFGTFIALLFTFFFASLLFGIMIKKFSGEKLKDMVNGVQIFVMLIVFLGFQIFNQLYASVMLESGLSGMKSVIYFFPPAWFATIPSLFEASTCTIKNIIFAVLTVVLSVAGYLAYLKLIAPSFERNLYKLTITEKSVKKRKPPRAMRFSSLFKSQTVKAMYEFSVLMFSRERKLKQAIYPLLVMGLFFPALMVFNSVSNADFDPSGSKQYFFIYYLVMMVIPLTIYTRFSDSYKAAWIFRFLPVKNPGDAIKGAQMAIFFSFQLPVIFLASMIFLITWKFTIIPDILAFAISSILIQLIYQNFTDNIIPFSQEFKTGQSSAFRQGAYFLTLFVFVPLLGGLHFASTLLPNGIFVYLVIQLIALWFLYRNHFKISWQEIDY